MLTERMKKLLRPTLAEVRRRYEVPWDFRNHRIGKPLKQHKADLRPRHPALLALEGYYDTEEIVVPEKFQEVYNQWKESGSSRRLTWWALKTGRLNEKQASELGNSLRTLRFKFSCRHNDFLRLGDTGHYYSCMLNDSCAGQQQLQYLADTDIAVVYVPDKEGKMMWRSLIRLVMEEGPARNKYPMQSEDGSHGFALVHYRVYGNGPTDAIFKKLDKLIQVYEAYDIRHYGVDRDTTKVLTSPTINNNSFLSRPIWTDHKGVGWDENRRIKIRALSRGDTYQYLKQEVRKGYGYGFPHHDLV